MVNGFFSLVNRAFYEIEWINIVQPEAPDDNMVHVHCMLVTYGYKGFQR